MPRFSGGGAFSSWFFINLCGCTGARKGGGRPEIFISQSLALRLFCTARSWLTAGCFLAAAVTAACLAAAAARRVDRRGGGDDILRCAGDGMLPVTK
jgi:hypothetical protein